MKLSSIRKTSALGYAFMSARANAVLFHPGTGPGRRAAAT